MNVKDWFKKEWKKEVKSTYWLARWVFLRLLGFIYFFAFLSLAVQVVPLIGEEGLLPADNFLEKVGSDDKWESFKKLPTLFWAGISDNSLEAFAWLGVALSIVLLVGYSNGFMLLLMWFLYMSFVHIGQLWYSYGWEIQLLETGFLALFLVPFWQFSRYHSTPPSKIIIYLMRWLAFRMYMGAGLIKIRGDECWRDLTCMVTHYETQPIPNPLSPWMHYMPKWYHTFGTLWNHFVELIVPFFVWFPRIARHAAGVLLITFQIYLIFSGNLSFLNWLTILPCIACFDDTFLKKLMPKKLVKKIKKKGKVKKWNQRAILAYLLIVIVLSGPVINNLLSPRQAMNTSFNQLHFVNTYGAFGSVGKVRYELVVSGTMDDVIMANSVWKEYEFLSKPTSLDRRLPIIAPYQPRIDWQIWFAAMARPEHYPWTVHLVWKLLHNDPGTLSLMSSNPFEETPPKHVKIDLYIYSFEKPWKENVWKREYVGNWLQPISKQTPYVENFVEANWG